MPALEGTRDSRVGCSGLLGTAKWGSRGELGTPSGACERTLGPEWAQALGTGAQHRCPAQAPREPPGTGARPMCPAQAPRETFGTDAQSSYQGGMPFDLQSGN